MEEGLIVNAQTRSRDRFFRGIRLVSSLQESKMQPLPTAHHRAESGGEMEPPATSRSGRE
jgi:hypothetical protein